MYNGTELDDIIPPTPNFDALVPLLGPMMFLALLAITLFVIWFGFSSWAKSDRETRVRQALALRELNETELPEWKQLVEKGLLRETELFNHGPDGLRHLVLLRTRYKESVDRS